MEDLKVPRVREGGFHPQILPYRRRTSLELSEAILALYAAGVSTRTISRFLEGIYGAFYSPQSISRLTQVVEEEVQAWRERPLGEEYCAVFLDGTFLSVRRGKTAKEALKKLRERWGNDLSSHRSPLGDQSLCASCVSAASSANPPVPVHHEPTGAAGERDETTDEGKGSGSVLRRGSTHETFVLGAPQPKRAPGRTSITGLCGSADGKLPCRPDTLNEALRNLGYCCVLCTTGLSRLLVYARRISRARDFATGLGNP
ncbi:MAG: transposase [Candidatus Methanomethyliaceae archaeon]